jgi:hypothetical protein
MLCFERCGAGCWNIESDHGLCAGRNLPSPLLAARHQLFLGDDEFIGKHLPQSADDKLSEISQAHRRAMAQPLADYAANTRTEIPRWPKPMRAVLTQWQKLLRSSVCTP